MNDVTVKQADVAEPGKVDAVGGHRDPGAQTAPAQPNTNSLNGPKPQDDPVFAKYGEPFLVDDKGKVHLNERAVAVKCASVHLVKYNPTLKAYERYDAPQGLWMPIHEVGVRRLLGDMLLQLAEKFNQGEFVKRNKNSQFSSLCKMMQPYQAEIQSENSAKLLHVSNGVLDLSGECPELLAHDPKYPFRLSPGHKYDPNAKCPMFSQELLEPALAKDDIALLQKYCGSMLLGPNTCHGILVIRGTAGGGKSTLVSIIEKVIGEQKVAHLRTKHLHGRFETSAFIGMRLLVGKDVPGDTLKENGARLLKSLVGGDLLQAEIKYNPTKQLIRGDYHVIIASNNRLRIALDGDEAAWGRRLLVVDFEKPKPQNPIPEFAELIVQQEASGILNWLVQGAMAYREEMKAGKLSLNENQRKRVDELLDDSDSVRAFVDARVVAQNGRDLSTEDLVLDYYNQCEQQHWAPVGEREFQKRVPDLLLQKYRVCRSHDIMREGKAKRGYRHIALATAAG